MLVVRAFGLSTPTTVRLVDFSFFRDMSLTVIREPTVALLSAVLWLTATSFGPVGARPSTMSGWAGMR